MEIIEIKTSREYNMFIGKGLLKDTGKYVSQIISPCKVCIVSDDTVHNLYADIASDSLCHLGFEVFHFTFEQGEKSKNINTISSILELMAENAFSRTDLIIALGGGITGDIAGFAASIYLRGIQFVQIPTTFLAAVDSSVGGKTGVNLKSGKNLTGTFWQPSLVLCDCSTFATLTFDIFLDGVAEAIKYGVIINKQLFELLIQQAEKLFTATHVSDDSSNSDTLIQIIKQCVLIKRDIVMEDERDNGIRQLLNFGHTIGHAIEKCSHYSITHGHAVALGMLIISKASYRLGLSEVDCSEEIYEILKLYKFPLDCPFTSDELTEVSLIDKKRTGNSITLVLPACIGHCYLKKIDISEIKSFISCGL